MEIEEFWALIESARTGDKAFDEALVDRLAAGSTDTILEFEERFEELDSAVYRWDVWGAAYLIGGGCSDDSFMDFRAGLIALGRDWYERAAQSPDSLADHPAVIAGVPAADRDDRPVFYEVVGYTAPRAFERLNGDECGFYEAWDLYRTARNVPESPTDMGEDFPFTADELRRRLPRLAALYLGEPANRAVRGDQGTGDT